MNTWILSTLMGLAGGAFVGLVGSLVGLQAGAEFGLWQLVYVAWIALLVTRRVDPPFLAGFSASLSSGVAVGVVHVALLDSYRESNPWYAEQLAVPDGELIAAFLGQGLIAGAIFGVAVGGITWAIRRRLDR